MNRKTVFGLALAILAMGATAAPSLTKGRTALTAACDAAEFHQFDFFAGDWDVYDMGASTVTARNVVTPMVGGCALREVHTQNDGLIGESISIYDQTRGVWHQSWVTNRGQLILLEGGMAEGRMVLTAPMKEADGTTSLIRGTWWPDGSTVRQVAERSTDGGKTWSPLWDIVFRPHRQ
jgi:hypothetical protein